MTRKDRFHKVIADNRAQLIQLGISSIGIFGSVARNEDTPNSDYDILVEFRQDKKSFKSFTTLCDLIEDNLGSNFELVTKESLSPYIGPRILQEVEYAEIHS